MSSGSEENVFKESFKGEKLNDENGDTGEVIDPDGDEISSLLQKLDDNDKDFITTGRDRSIGASSLKEKSIQLEIRK